MKKLLSLILAAAMAAMLLTGCSSDSKEPAGSSNTPAPSSGAPAGEPTELVVATWGGTTGAALKEIVAPLRRKTTAPSSLTKPPATPTASTRSAPRRTPPRSTWPF